MSSEDGNQPMPSVTRAELRCLLVILSQSEKWSYAATNMIAAELEVKPPTVCKLLNHMIDKQLVLKAPYGKVTLTTRGMQMARLVKNRVSALQDSVARQLRLNDSASLQTALFIACHLDEENQQRVLRSGQAGDCSQAGLSISPITQTDIGQEAVI